MSLQKFTNVLGTRLLTRAAPIGAVRVGERATRTARPTLPSSNRRCRFPASGSPENSRLRHAQAPKVDGVPTAPDAPTRILLAEAGTAAGCGAANAGSDGPEHTYRSHSRHSWGTQWKSSSPNLAGAGSALQSGPGLV